MRPGSWTPFETKITTDELTIFKNATNPILGVGYTPLAVSTQVVSGVNYSFFCNATVATPTENTYAALVEVYRQPDGSIHLTEIRKVEY